MDLIVQVLAGIGVIACGALAIYFHPKRLETKTLVLVTLLVCITLVLNGLSIMIPLFGSNSFKVSFEQVPVLFIGILYGPFWGFFGAVVADTLSTLINPQGPYFIGFLLSRVLVAMIPAFLFSPWIKFKRDTMLRIAQVVIAVLCVGATLFIIQTNEITVSKAIVTIDGWVKVSLILLCFVLSSFLIVMIQMMSKMASETMQDFTGRYILAVIMVELVVQMLLTPIWINVMYGVPFILNLFVRVLSGSLMIPLKIFIGISLQRIVFSKLLTNKKDIVN